MPASDFRLAGPKKSVRRGLSLRLHYPAPPTRQDVADTSLDSLEARL